MTLTHPLVKLKTNALQSQDMTTPFMERVRLGLDVSIERLAEILDISVDDTKEYCATGIERTTGEDDAIYERLLVYVNERVGAGLVIRSTLYRKLQADRTARLARRESIRSR